MIEFISMGKLLFNGKLSRSDTIVYKDHIDSRWWINNRTYIDVCDLEDVFAEEPDVVVVGVGFFNPVTIADQAIETMKSKGIEVIVEKAEKAAEIFNEMVEKRKTVGLFHLL